MATCLRNVLKQFVFAEKQRLSLILIQTRGSRYDKFYLPPTVSKEEVSQPLPEDDPRRFYPIKAAGSSETTLSSFDPVLNKFTNMIMKDGKKKTAREIVDKTLESIKRIQIQKYHRADDMEKASIELNPVNVFHAALENCKPVLRTLGVTKGGIRYQVPVPCTPQQQMFKAMKWIIESSKQKERTQRFYDKLAYELLEAANNEGKSVRKKQELHRLCEENKAFAHYIK